MLTGDKQMDEEEVSMVSKTRMKVLGRYYGMKYTPDTQEQRSKSSRFQRSRLLSLFSMNSDRTVVQTWGPKGRRLAWWLKYHVGCPHSMKEWEVKSQPHFRFHLPANAHCGWHLVMPNVPATLMEPWTESLALSWVFVAGVRMLNQQMEALSACHCPSSSKKIKINTF